MKDRNWQRGIHAGLTLGVLALALALGPSDSSAGVIRDFFDKVSGKNNTPPPPPPAGTRAVPFQGYACCNLHYDGDTITDSNYAELPLIPAGTPIDVLSYDKNRAFIKINGAPMRLDHEHARNRESLEAWVNKIVVQQDPRPRIAAYAPAIREAIHLGKVMIGMTREQAIISIGYPLPNENLTLDAPTWRVYRSRRGQYQLNFGEDGHIASVTGDGDVTSEMIHMAQK
jgi:hypothetical protein